MPYLAAAQTALAGAVAQSRPSHGSASISVQLASIATCPDASPPCLSLLWSSPPVQGPVPPLQDEQGQGAEPTREARRDLEHPSMEAGTRQHPRTRRLHLHPMRRTRHHRTPPPLRRPLQPRHLHHPLPLMLRDSRRTQSEARMTWKLWQKKQRPYYLPNCPCRMCRRGRGEDWSTPTPSPREERR